MASIIQAIIAVVNGLKIIRELFNSIARMFRKDPIKQIIEEEKKHDDAAKKAERSDDTSGSFGG